ncbi:MAG: hypothetical protein HN742_33310 [Lentisphaerae bacterium]|jgi:hypothetical protein|nr:hypothetical protein [Lentisphaerota bacterium]MBT5606551.1 hypothetical protein [Lentisphaerota bacterium]MBT7053460.1 hypothetical protein [Lentisphaerota bacterium]MBT7846797.1 hypothetical protein [Lentisphaerota bacterium]
MLTSVHAAATLVTFAAIGATALAQPGAPKATEAVTFYIAPDGRDTWSGTHAAPLPDGTDGPFATIQRAQNAVRPKAGRQTIHVLIREGVYYLTAPIVFTPQDSGTAEAPVTYSAFPGETPLLSGGRPITNVRANGNAWIADIPEAENGGWVFQQLFVNGGRRPRARHPSKGFLRMAGPLPSRPPQKEGGKPIPDKSGFLAQPGDVRTWHGSQDIRAVLIHSWETSIHPIKAIDVTANTVTFTAPLKEWWTVGYWEKQGRYYLENSVDFLDTPGEWFLDTSAGRLTYMPLPGETIETTEFVGPVLSEFIRFAGDAAAGLFVEHVAVRGLSLQHADWTLSPTGNSSTQAAVDVPAVITADGARFCSFEDCTVAHVGNYGIWIRKGCKDCVVSGNHLYDVGAGGVRVGDAKMAERDDEETSRTLVHNNYIHDYGEVYAAGVGVWVAQSSHNRITNNEIHDGYYSGISAGWNWNKAPNRTHHNTFERNHVHHVVRGVLSDGAGIYTLGTQTGTVIRNNLFHDIFPYMGNPTMAWGIYFDAGSNGLLAENNIVFNTLTGGLMNTGQSNNTIRNNIFALSAWHAVWRWRFEEPPPSTIERNIFYLTQGALFRPDAGADDTVSKWDRNLYWRSDGKPLSFYDDTFVEWQAKGLGTHSLVADPLFVNPAEHDFRLRPNSPAFKVGFTPIDPALAGLEDKSRWAAFPRPHPIAELPPLPPEPEPELIHESFEDTPIGTPPLHAFAHTEDRPESIAVTDELAASGSRCLKVTDGPHFENIWNPHVFYQPHFRDGKAVLTFDLRLEQGAVFSHAWRDARRPFSVGPSLSIEPDGRLLANNALLCSVPFEQWLRVSIACGLGAGCHGTYDLAVATADGTRLADRKGIPFGSPKFRTLEWLGFVSLAREVTTFYLDNISLDLEKN